MSQTFALVPMNPGSAVLANVRPCSGLHWGIYHRSLGMLDRPVLTCQRPFSSSLRKEERGPLPLLPASLLLARVEVTFPTEPIRSF